MRYRIIEVNISQIRSGDTILHRDGKIRTVSKGDIKHDPFMGWSLFGDSYDLGYTTVKKLLLQWGELRNTD